MDDDDFCEIIEIEDVSANDKHDDVKPKLDDVEVDQLSEKLRNELMHCESYWQRKSTFLTTEVGGKIPVIRLKLLELELGIHYRNINEIVSAVKYLHKYCKNNETFRARIEELNALTEENRGTPFANELLSKLGPAIFLEPLLASAGTLLSKFQALIALAKTIGMRQVAKKIYDLYMKIHVKMASGETQLSGYDLIWFHLNSLLCDGDLCGLDPDHALIIYQSMLRCCLADARGDLDDEFFVVSESLGFLRINPRDHWRPCLRLLIEVLYCRNITCPTPLAQNLMRQFDTLSFVQISQKFVLMFDVKKDEEIVRFLLNYAISMKKFYEGERYVVFMPARIFDISKRFIKNYWSTSTEPREKVADDELDFKNVLPQHGDQYLDISNIARNVYLAYQKTYTDSEHDIDSNLRLLLQGFSNAFLVIGQSILMAGRFSEAAKFTHLAILSTKNKEEQTMLILLLLEANVAMRHTKQALTYALDLLSESELVETSVMNASGMLQNCRFEDDCFIWIPKNCVYHYVSLLLLNTSVISFAKWQAKSDNDMMNISATIIVLCVQCAWPFCVDMLKGVFELVDSEIFILNAIKIISNRVLFTRLIDTGVKFMEGSETFTSTAILNKFKDERLDKKITRFTAFQDLALYIKSHNEGRNRRSMSIIQLLFA